MKVAEAVHPEQITDAAEPVIDFEDLMAKEQKRVFLLCLRLLRNQDEADTATQDVFLKAYRALQQSGDGAIQQPSKWLTRVACNTCCDRLRSRRWLFWLRHRSNSDEDTLLRLTRASGPNQEDAVAAGDIRKRLENALKRLSVRQRVVFLLRHEEGQSIEEIAEAMKLDTGTVKAHMARALKKLREELRDLYAR